MQKKVFGINNCLQIEQFDPQYAFRKYAPGFKAKIVKDVGHVIMWDNPEEFNRLLEESIQEFDD